jgi:hypothetical protein
MYCFSTFAKPCEGAIGAGLINVERLVRLSFQHFSQRRTTFGFHARTLVLVWNAERANKYVSALSFIVHQSYLGPRLPAGLPCREFWVVAGTAGPVAEAKG